MSVWSQVVAYCQHLTDGNRAYRVREDGKPRPVPKEQAANMKAAKGSLFKRKK